MTKLCVTCEFQYLPDGDESVNQKKERRLEMAKKRLANSEVVRDLHREYTDGPDEIRVSVSLLMLILIGYNVHLV